MVVLVPRQLQMTGMTGNVPYYGGRMSPAQAYAASHPRPAAAAPPPPPPPAPATPSRDPAAALAALDALLESGTISQAEHDELSSRVAP